MLILNQIKAITPAVLSGIIETDETFQRESRSGMETLVPQDLARSPRRLHTVDGSPSVH
ncbi:hypothetical protein [Pseudorhodobacter aquimaris]|uniref:hypothetical protein n=1 Tax=Pseudorhodobacter aquimaris TaxID=687412 RepID=UPI000B1F7B8A